MIDLFSRASIQMHARVKHFPSFNSVQSLFMMDYKTPSYLTVQFCQANVRTSFRAVFFKSDAYFCQYTCLSLDALFTNEDAPQQRSQNR